MRKKRAHPAEKKVSIRKVIAIFLFIILAAFVICQTYNKDVKENVVQASSPECIKNSDCLIIRGSCCSCEEGGSPQCISKSKLTEYTKKLEECSKDGSCFGVDCGKISCGCLENKCVGIPS